MNIIHQDQIIVAFDTQEEQRLNFLINELKGKASYVKVGMELYYRFGPRVIEQLKENDFKIFLDLKMHDIPNTVYSACKALGSLGVDILNVHASGGIEMMKMAKQGLLEGNSSGLLIGVTQLTSTTQIVLNNELRIEGTVQDSVLNLAKLTQLAGLDGIVCSALEVKEIKHQLGSEFKCITPGIRPLGMAAQDQKRIMSPEAAINEGSDYLVIGRPITQAKSPAQALTEILEGK